MVSVLVVVEEAQYTKQVARVCTILHAWPHTPNAQLANGANVARYGPRLRWL
jgi:hypothetical protein